MYDRYKGYWFEIKTHHDDDYPGDKHYSYVIYSKEAFETQQEARFAAIGHISIIEQGVK